MAVSRVGRLMVRRRGGAARRRCRRGTAGAAAQRPPRPPPAGSVVVVLDGQGSLGPLPFLPAGVQSTWLSTSSTWPRGTVVDVVDAVRGGGRRRRRAT